MEEQLSMAKVKFKALQKKLQQKLQQLQEQLTTMFLHKQFGTLRQTLQLTGH